MAQAIHTIKVMPIDQHTPYYTVQPRQNHVLKAKNQMLHVIAGTAWVSINQQDYILKAGEAITLTPGGDAVVAVSSMLGKAVHYTLSD